MEHPNSPELRESTILYPLLSGVNILPFFPNIHWGRISLFWTSGEEFYYLAKDDNMKILKNYTIHTTKLPKIPTNL